MGFLILYQCYYFAKDVRVFEFDTFKWYYGSFSITVT